VVFLVLWLCDFREKEAEIDGWFLFIEWFVFVTLFERQKVVRLIREFLGWKKKIC